MTQTEIIFAAVGVTAIIAGVLNRDAVLVVIGCVLLIGAGA